MTPTPVSPTPGEETLDLGTDQVIVLNEYQDAVVYFIEPEGDDEDDDKRELVCR